MEAMVGRWFGVLFLAIGAFSLFGSAMGIIDYTSRLAADILKTTYLPRSTMSESRMYFWLVWGMVGLGCSILLVGMSQPITLLVISASTGGTIMFLYSMLLIALNKTHAARGDSHQLVPHGHAGVVDAAVRLACDVYDLRSGATISTVAVTVAQRPRRHESTLTFRI